jgi:hypothetical protein
VIVLVSYSQALLPVYVLILILAIAVDTVVYLRRMCHGRVGRTGIRNVWILVSSVGRHCGSRLMV